MDARESIGTNAEKVSEIFKSGKFTLAIAESFTGGNVVASLVAIPGASSFVLEGLTCYSNESKCARLGVKAETLDKFGAVSENTVREMIDGLLVSPLKPDFAVATTGNAGPGTEPLSDPGECYVAAGNKNDIIVKRFSLSGSREENIFDGTNEALALLIKFVKKQRGE